eukprot:PhF_6_TR27206/c1_g1_i2/m.40009
MCCDGCITTTTTVLPVPLTNCCNVDCRSFLVGGRSLPPSSKVASPVHIIFFFFFCQFRFYLHTNLFCFFMNIVIVTYLSTFLLIQDTGAIHWKVACRLGQPPMNDYIHLNVSTHHDHCSGLFSDIFTTAADRLGLSYTVTPTDSDISKLMANETGYDLVIAFHTVTPDKLVQYDYSAVIMESYNVIALRPAYRKSQGDFSA